MKTRATAATSAAATRSVATLRSTRLQSPSARGPSPLRAAFISQPHACSTRQRRRSRGNSTAPRKPVQSAQALLLIATRPSRTASEHCWPRWAIISSPLRVCRWCPRNTPCSSAQQPLWQHCARATSTATRMSWRQTSASSCLRCSP
ncbi:hypothetical protein T492DRAFT_964901 [Pavlovales sp. CCMP2436]|nr:hypothetical protein T492DRAFT_964901 [Pavlovales sp. CCMP2436]